MVALKDLMTAFGSPNLDCRQDGAKLPAGPRGAYLFNSGIAGIEQADVILLVGTNPRSEAAIVNARIRKRWLKSGLTVGVVGPAVDLTYRTRHLGAGPETLAAIADGTDGFAEVLRNAKAPMLIVGQGALAREDGAQVLAACRRIAETYGLVRDDWNGFNVLHTAAARVGGLDLGFVPGPGGRDVAGILDGAEQGRDRLRLAARRRRDRHRPAGQRLRGLSGPSRRPRRPSRRRDPAGRRLHREERAPTSTPRAACSRPAWRCSRRARRARTGRSCAPLSDVAGPQAALSTACARCASAWSR